jgi:uncharacterized protein YcbX
MSSLTTLLLTPFIGALLVLAVPGNYRVILRAVALQTGVLTAGAEGRPDFAGDLNTPGGRGAFEAWLAALLGEAATGPLNIIEGPGAHRFMDHPLGHVSIINLASVRDLAANIGRPIDPLRFRANLYVEGWDAWAENDWAGRTLSLGAARATVYKPIVRCAATAVDQEAGDAGGSAPQPGYPASPSSMARSGSGCGHESGGESRFLHETSIGLRFSNSWRMPSQRLLLSVRVRMPLTLALRAK